MPAHVWLCSNALFYLEGAGHLWVYLNWALGLRANGCTVTWVEPVWPDFASDLVQRNTARLRAMLAPFGLGERIALVPGAPGQPPLPRGLAGVPLDEAREADLLLSLDYKLPAEVVSQFRRTALVDIDPGLFQLWVSRGLLDPARYDTYFSIGETVGEPGCLFPDLGLRWHHTRPCVALDRWPVAPPPPADAPLSTISHWYASEWLDDLEGKLRLNDKRTGFAPFLGLPRRTAQPLELALCLGGDEIERRRLEGLGWRIRESHEVTATLDGYRDYIARCRGEFSAVKPSCVWLQNAWISDRTVCFLASGRPALVQHTGRSRYLPERAGLLRFRTLDEAVELIDLLRTDYDSQARAARRLAETHFDACQVTAEVLDAALR